MIKTNWAIKKTIYICPNRIIFQRKMSIDGKVNYDDGSFIFYKQRKVEGSTKPGVIFCSGYNSNLNGNKAEFLDRYCEKNNLSYLRFDYIGHKYSSGTMHDALLSTWKQNFIDVMDKLTKGPQVVVGSSIGAWVGFLGAIERTERIHSIITIANAIDCMHTRFSDASPDQQKAIKQTGYYTIPNDDSIIPYAFFEDCKHHLLLEPSIKQIPLNCPIRMIHGMADDVVSYQTSVKVAEKVSSTDVVLQLVKDGDHRLSSERDLNYLEKLLDETLDVGGRR